MELEFSVSPVFRVCVRERERDSGRPARGSGGQSECREGQPVSVGGQPKGLEASEGQGGQPQGLHASQSI